MNDEEKKAPAPGLGFHPAQARKYRMERLARPSQWSPGVRVTSAEEYDRFTDQLARELLATCTLDSLAIIAAQHMMYADELKCVLEEQKTEQVAAIAFARKATTDAITAIVTKVTMAVLTAYRTHISDKRAKAVTEGKRVVITLARDTATEMWSKDIEQKIRIGEMATLVYSALLETEHHKSVSGPSCVKRWIRPVAPGYASKAGR